MTPAQDNINAFVQAAARGDMKEMQVFLTEYPKAADARDGDGLTALFCAAHEGWKPVIAMLLSWGAHINATASNGMTPLMAAAVKAPPAISEFLLEEGADETLRDDRGRTARDVAAARERAGLMLLYDVRQAEAEARAKQQAAPLEKLRRFKPKNPFGKGPGAG